jgi:membrane dipeptidase
MKLFLALLLIISLASCSKSEQSNPPDKIDPVLMERANELAQKFIIVDGHIDVPYRLKNKWEDLSQKTTEGHFDYVRAKAGGLNAPFMSIYVPARFQKTGEAKQVADELIDMVYGVAEKWPDKFEIATNEGEMKREVEENKISLFMGMENGAPIEDNLENLQYFYDRGIRYITLAHSKNNLICDSSYDSTRQWNGLSEFGEKVVTEMNHLGIMIDISHVTDSTFYEVMALSTAPVIASHSSCRYFTPGWERNMNDDMIIALAENGGVMMMNFGSSFLKGEYYDQAEKVEAEIKKYLKDHHLNKDDEHAKIYEAKIMEENVLGDVQDVVAHIDHVVNLVGVDYVGFGSDFDGVSFLPRGLEDVSKYPNLIYELLKKGYSEEDIEKICSGNILRVMSDVQNIAEYFQSI